MNLEPPVNFRKYAPADLSVPRARADSNASLHVPQRRKEACQDVSRMLGVVSLHHHIEGQNETQLDAFSGDLSESILMGQLAQQRRRAQKCPHKKFFRAPDTSPHRMACASPVSLDSKAEASLFQRRPRVRPSPTSAAPFTQKLTSRFSDFSSCESAPSPKLESKFSDASSPDPFSDPWGSTKNGSSLAPSEGSVRLETATVVRVVASKLGPSIEPDA